MKILIVGDSCKDVFIYGDITRLSPEAPVPVFNPRKTIENDGMAKNVANNVEVLGSTIYTITNMNSIKKVRYVDKSSNHMVLRVDEHDYCNRIDTDILSKIRNNKCHVSMSGDVEVDAIIISDYCKGFLEEDDIQFICENNDNVFVDTKKKLSSWIESADFIKINFIEYTNNKELLHNNKALLDKTIITCGDRGCIFRGDRYSVEKVPIKDLSGAGDTFLAGLVVEYLKSNDIVKAINFAQECTTIVVQKHGVSTI